MGPIAIGTPTLKPSAGSATDGTLFTTAASQFVTGRVYFLTLQYSNGISANTPPPSSVVTTGVTWTQVTHNQYKTTGTNRTACAMYWGIGSSGAGTVTTAINFAATTTGCRWIMVEYTGIHTTTPYVTGNVATAAASPIAGGTITATLAAFTDGGSRSFAMMGSNFNSTTMDCDPDWTQFDEHAHTLPAEAIMAAWSTNQTAFTVTNNSATTNTTGLIVIELRPAPVSSTLGRGNEIDLGRTPILAKVLTHGLAVEADAGRVVALAKTVALGRAAEVDAGLALSSVKASTLARAVEVDAARALAVAGTATLGQAAEVDAARALSATETVALARALESDAGRSLTVTRAATTLGRAAETDAGRTVTLAKVYTLGRAVETDAGRALDITAQGTTYLNPAVEVDAGRPVTLAKVYVLGRASESNSGRALGFTHVILPRDITLTATPGTDGWLGATGTDDWSAGPVTSGRAGGQGTDGWNGQKSTGGWSAQRGA